MVPNFYLIIQEFREAIICYPHYYSNVPYIQITRIINNTRFKLRRMLTHLILYWNGDLAIRKLYVSLIFYSPYTYNIICLLFLELLRSAISGAFLSNSTTLLFEFNLHSYAKKDLRVTKEVSVVTCLGSLFYFFLLRPFSEVFFFMRQKLLSSLRPHEEKSFNKE